MAVVRTRRYYAVMATAGAVSCNMSELLYDYFFRDAGWDDKLRSPRRAQGCLSRIYYSNNNVQMFARVGMREAPGND